MTLPDDTVEEAERLTRLAREAVDDAAAEAYREERDDLLAEHGFIARVRSEDTHDVLVCHPEEWLDEAGRVDVTRVEDTSRAVEVPLSGPGDGADWDAVEAHNRRVAERVAAEHGDVHGQTAHAFADFMSNHYAKPIGEATPAEREEFRTDYFLRNAWPTDEQREMIEESVELALVVAASVEERA